MKGFLVLTLLIAQVAIAQKAPLRVMSSNGVKAVVDDLRLSCERAIGHPIEIQFGTAVSLKQKIDAGEPFDVALLTSDVIDELIKTGKIAEASRVNMARSGIGIGVRAGEAKPDIRTNGVLKATLLNAKSIAYPGDGASRVHVEEMLERLGITNEIKPKAILAKGSAGAGTSVTSRQADLLLTLMSEIPPLAGVELVGPLPADVQGYVYFAAGIGVKADNAEAGKALIRLLTNTDAHRVYIEKGMDPAK